MSLCNGLKTLSLARAGSQHHIPILSRICRHAHRKYSPDLSNLPEFAGKGKFKLRRQLKELLVQNGGNYELGPDGRSLHGTYKFPDFRSAAHFLKNIYNRISSARHHPQMTNARNVVTFVWTTHNGKGVYGISKWDVRLATEAERLAKAWNVSQKHADQYGQGPLSNTEAKRLGDPPIYLVQLNAVEEGQDELEDEIEDEIEDESKDKNRDD